MGRVKNCTRLKIATDSDFEMLFTSKRKCVCLCVRVCAGRGLFFKGMGSLKEKRQFSWFLQSLDVIIASLNTTVLTQKRTKSKLANIGHQKAEY